MKAINVTFSYMQVGHDMVGSPKIWDTYPDSTVLIHGKKLKNNYQEITMPWNEMFRMIQSSYRAISSAVVKNGHMKEDNFTSMNIVLLDFDEGYRLQEMLERFGNYTYLIHTSRNHMKNKGKKGVAERFRVILPLSRTYTDKAALRLAMKFIVEELYKDFGIDIKCKDLTRIMFTGGANCQYYYNSGIFFPFDEIIELASSWQKKRQLKCMRKQSMKPVYYNNLKNITKADWYRENFNTKIMYEKLNFDEKAVNGRNNALYQTGYYLLSEVGLTEDEVYNALLYINDTYCNPLDEREIQSTVFRSLKIGGVA